ncbi:MAG: DNA polymerase [Candidatus Roizmanbacteria bacterium]
MVVTWDPVLAHFLLSGGIALTQDELIEKYQKTSLDEVITQQHELFTKYPELSALYHDIELPVSEIISDMHTTGIHIDQMRLKAVEDTLQKKREQLSMRLGEQLGGVNLNSPKQLGDALVTTLKITLPKTKTGQWSTGYDVLEPLSKEHALIAEILEFRAVDKILGTYVEPIHTFITSDGRIHPTYIQTAAATGRLACKDPNIQSTPITGEFGAMVRSYYTAPSGSILIGCDYSQQELRILAHLADDTKLKEAFENNQDVHTATASELLDIPLKHIGKAERAIGKTLNFGIVYGETAYGLARQLGKPVAECAHILHKYFETHSGVKRYFDNLLIAAKIQGRVETMMGRHRGVPGKRVGEPVKFLTAEQERILKNFPIQGSAADMTKTAMVRVVRDVLPRYPMARLIMQIHDELIFEYHHGDTESDKQTKIAKDDLPVKTRGEIDRFCHDIVTSMQNAVALSVPVVVSSSTGHAWSQLK